MKKYLSFVLYILIFSGCGSNNNNLQEQPNEESQMVSYSEYKTSKMFYTLADGTAKEDSISITFRYNQQQVQVEFPDSTWTFEVVQIEQKPEGTTIKIKDKRLKKYKEIFIAAGDLLMINFITHTETGNLTLM